MLSFHGKVAQKTATLTSSGRYLSDAVLLVIVFPLQYHDREDLPFSSLSYNDQELISLQLSGLLVCNVSAETLSLVSLSDAYL